jgi:hypothetical protein
MPGMTDSIRASTGDTPAVIGWPHSTETIGMSER